MLSVKRILSCGSSWIHMDTCISGQSLHTLKLNNCQPSRIFLPHSILHTTSRMLLLKSFLFSFFNETLNYETQRDSGITSELLIRHLVLQALDFTYSLASKFCASCLPSKYQWTSDLSDSLIFSSMFSSAVGSSSYILYHISWCIGKKSVFVVLPIFSVENFIGSYPRCGNSLCFPSLPLHLFHPQCLQRRF